MDLSRYQKLASRTINPELDGLDTMRHGLFTLSSETGEVLGLFQKEYQGHPLEREHLVKELGDCLWAIAEICTSCDLDMSEIAETNIEKLEARYPNGFTTENSLHRAEGDI